MDLTTATPVEIDTVLADLYSQENAALARVDAARTSVWHDAGARRSWHGTWDMSYADAIEKVQHLAENDQTYKGREARETLARLDAAKAKVAEVREQAAPLNAEFDRRGGWTRAFLVLTSGRGHVHSSMTCSTCNRQGNATVFSWMVEYSGKDESEIVEAAGERACTVCYPTAPVETLNRPTQMFSEDEKAAVKAREERAVKKAAADAKKIANGLTADGSEFVVTYVDPQAGQHRRNAEGRTEHFWGPKECTERFKTERAAMQWVVQYVSWGHDLRTDYMAPGFAQVIEAVAAKHGQTVAEVTAEVEAKVAAKAKRDGR